MKMSKRNRDLGHVELYFRLAKPALHLHVLEDLASLQVVHDEVHAVCALKHKLHGYDEGMSDLKHN
jgi:hypothetical protein